MHGVRRLEPLGLSPLTERTSHAIEFKFDPSPIKKPSG